jgi:hypothetical protein
MKFDKEFKRAFSQGKVKVSQRGVRLATADTMDASLHIPQHTQPAIGPQCETCHGAGWVEFSHVNQCMHCGGTGQQQASA